MADPVNASVLADQRSYFEPVADLIRAEAGIQELPPGDDSVGSSSDPSYPPFRTVEFWGHWP
jgi:hypothetical protein